MRKTDNDPGLDPHADARLHADRRRFLGGAAAVAAAAQLPGVAASQSLIRKAISSSAEAIPAIGVGTARRYQGASSEHCAIPGMARPEYVVDNMGAAAGRLPDPALRKRMEAFIDAL